MEDQFKIQQYGDQVYIKDLENFDLLHAQIKGPQQAQIHIHTGACIEIVKMYGPLVFMDIRVTLDFQTCEWVIERADKGNEWREVARIPGQLESDFHDYEPPPPRDPTRPERGWSPLEDFLRWFGRFR